MTGSKFWAVTAIRWSSTCSGIGATCAFIGSRPSTTRWDATSWPRASAYPVRSDPARRESRMTTREIIDSYFKAINSEDWDLLESVVAPDATYQSTGARPRSGRSDVVNFFHGAFRAWSVHDDKPTSLIVDGDSAAAEVTFTGTTLDGRVLSFDAID